MPTGEHFSRLELVDRTAVGALAFAVVGDIDIHLGVAVPQLHVSLEAGAVNTALLVQIFGSQFDDGSSTHGGCLSRRWMQSVHADRVNFQSYGQPRAANRYCAGF